MGYPLRWEQVAAPQKAEEAVVKRAAHANSFSQYFRRLVAVTFAGSAVIVFTVIGLSSYFLRDQRMPVLPAESLPAGAVVSAKSPHIVRRLGYLVVTGSVMNRSAKSLSRVEAVLDLLAADRHTLHSESAMVESDSVAPGSSSTFRLAMADAPNAAAYRLRFRRLNGSDLN